MLFDQRVWTLSARPGCNPGPKRAQRPHSILRAPQGRGRPCCEAENSACRGEQRRGAGSLTRRPMSGTRERERGALPPPLWPRWFARATGVHRFQPPSGIRTLTQPEASVHWLKRRRAPNPFLSTAHTNLILSDSIIPFMSPRTLSVISLATACSGTPSSASPANPTPSFCATNSSCRSGLPRAPSNLRFAPRLREPEDLDGAVSAISRGLPDRTGNALSYWVTRRKGAAQP